ncbi:hypothetical protein B0T17DRAFT_507376 [Bombardia bombarda]|uniref:Uncharacterized protein n=1 Tax=Bombardia bombarda TaxID=252184 RepID=A0AA39XBM3_9PEZI|nr:hypothetical protein B0T17DRAFT_507376 [Bombardia bombarda]
MPRRSDLSFEAAALGAAPVSGVRFRNEGGRRDAYVSAAKVSPGQLKQYLDSKYPGQYSVQLFKQLCEQSGVCDYLLQEHRITGGFDVPTPEIHIGGFHHTLDEVPLFETSNVLSQRRYNLKIWFEPFKLVIISLNNPQM